MRTEDLWNGTRTEGRLAGVAGIEHEFICSNCDKEVNVALEGWHVQRGGHGAGVCNNCYEEYLEMNADLLDDEIDYW